MIIYLLRLKILRTPVSPAGGGRSVEIGNTVGRANFRPLQQFSARFIVL
jgi:hypothetical protein